MIIVIIWFGFIAYQPLFIIQCQIHFYAYKLLYFKQFNLVQVQFFVYSQLNVENRLVKKVSSIAMYH